MSEPKSTPNFNADEPLAPIDGETLPAHTALLAYWRLGDERSLVRTAEVLERPPGYARQLAEWSSTHAWQRRIMAQATLEARRESDQRVRLRAKRRAELEDQDWQDGAELRAKLREVLAELPKFIKRSERVIDEGAGRQTRIVQVALNATPGDLARAIAAASALQHQATDAHLIVEEQLEQALERLREVLDEESYAKALAAIAGVDLDAGGAPAR